MKKIFILTLLVAAIGIGKADAQLEQGNVLVGGQLANLGFGLGDQSKFTMAITPTIGYFIRDNVAVGGKVGLGYQTIKGQGDQFDYAVNAFGRYYLSSGEAGVNTLLNHGRFFGELGLGIAGTNGAAVGFNFNIGPGYAYFITPNVALETSLMYNHIGGTGTSDGLGLNLGFQIHLPSGRLKQMRDNPSSL